MRRIASVLCLVAAAGAQAQSGIDGTLVDGTNGGPGRADRVALLKLGEDLSTVATLDAVTGSFHFDLAGPGPYLVQAQKDGVTYNAMIPPQERGVATPSITVYDSTRDTSGISVSLPHWVVVVNGPRLNVLRVYEITNGTKPPRTVVGDETGGGAFRFDVPDAATVSSATVTSGKMPLRQDPVETPDRRGKTIAYGLRPGVTRFEIEMELPYSGSAEVHETLYHGATQVTAFVVPATVEVDAGDLGRGEKRERQGMSLTMFHAENLPAGRVLTLKISGEATAAPPASSDGAEDGAADSPGAMRGEIRKAPPRLARGRIPALVLVLLGSLLGSAFLAGLGKPRPEPAAAAVRRRLSPRAESLLDELGRLDREHASGRLAPAEHQAARAARKRELVEEIESRRDKKKPA